MHGATLHGIHKTEAVEKPDWHGLHLASGSFLCWGNDPQVILKLIQLGETRKNGQANGLLQVDEGTAHPVLLDIRQVPASKMTQRGLDGLDGLEAQSQSRLPADLFREMRRGKTLRIQAPGIMEEAQIGLAGMGDALFKLSRHCTIPRS